MSGRRHFCRSSASDRDPFPLLTSDDALAVHAVALTSTGASKSCSRPGFAELPVAGLCQSRQGFLPCWRSPQRVNTQGQSRNVSGSAAGSATEPRGAGSGRRITSKCRQGSSGRIEKEEIATGRPAGRWKALHPRYLVVPGSTSGGDDSSNPAFTCFSLAQQRTCLDLSQKADCQQPWPASSALVPHAVPG